MKLTAEEVQEVALACYLDPVLFLQTFLKAWFPEEVPWFHRGIIAIVLRKTDFLHKYGQIDKIVRHFVYRETPSDKDSPLLPIFRLEADGTLSIVISKNTLLMMPRGYSKTTLMNGLAIYNIVYKLKEFLAYLSETATHAENQLSNVKKQLEGNEEIQLVFGNVVPSRQDSKKWTSDQLETTTDVAAIARGRGGQIRGSNVDAKRPDLILIDDVEDQESVSTPEQLEKTRKWFFEAVLPALAKMKEDAAIFAVGTLLSKDALLATLANDPEWTTIILSAIDLDGEPLWERNMSLADLDRKKQSFALVGNLSGYYREYHNKIRADEGAKFKPSYIHIGLPAEEIVGVALAVDPAISEKKKSDYHAQAAVGITERGRIVILDVDGKRGLTPREQVDWFFEWHFKYKPTKHGIEAVAYQKALLHLMREEMFRKRAYFDITAITHGISKLTRVEGVLQPRYAAGYILHARPLPLYTQQLLDWPNDKLDLPDAVAMAITLLDPYAAQAADPEHDLQKDEYEPLSKVLGKWRSAP